MSHPIPIKLSTYEINTLMMLESARDLVGAASIGNHLRALYEAIQTGGNLSPATSALCLGSSVTQLLINFAIAKVMKAQEMTGKKISADENPPVKKEADSHQVVGIESDRRVLLYSSSPSHDTPPSFSAPIVREWHNREFEESLPRLKAFRDYESIVYGQPAATIVK